MAEPFSIERRKLMRMLGARVIVTPKAGKGTGMVEKAQDSWLRRMDGSYVINLRLRQMRSSTMRLL